MTTSFFYHQTTSYDRHDMSAHALDWEHQPVPYKMYPGIQPVPLPEIRGLYPGTLGHAAGIEGISPSGRALDMEDLSKILYLANGLTGKARQGGADFYFRSAPSAGALYPNEIYLVWPGGGDPAPGVYHCGIHNRSLIPLRQGNFVPLFRAPAEVEPSDPIAVFVISGIFFRSAWKYRARAYRYVLMDAGHVMESLRLAIRAAGFSCRLSFAFDDAAVNLLLGLDPEREAGIGCVYVYGSGKNKESATPDAPPNIKMNPLPESIREACKTSGREIRYKEILDIHRAGFDMVAPIGPPADMMDCLGVSHFPFGQIRFPKGLNVAEAHEKQPLSYAHAVYTRRSRRNFVPQPMGRDELAYMLDLVCRASDASMDGDHGYASPIAVGLLAGNVDGMAPGFYLIDTRKRRLHRVFEGHVTGEMATVCLDQRWLVSAGAHFLFMTNPEVLDRQWSARGYRYAMLTAGRLGHAVYLGATALGLGACGIGAIYDGEARRLLGLNPASALVYVVAAGAVKGN
ncbi:MAG: SagB/ThcOx family dehydrogenase [Desulfosalsimonadaceae bacterium]|nr:SagB/ThcOx family dehydrogenase [Desulfosalsimonadaceae bacterium]